MVAPDFSRLPLTFADEVPGPEMLGALGSLLADITRDGDALTPNLMERVQAAQVEPLWPAVKRTMWPIAAVVASAVLLVAEQMAPLPVLNRAFGGSRTGDQLFRFEQVVLPYRPKVIVYYCGSNDIKATAADAPEVIFGRFREFSERVRKELPGTRLIFVSSTRSPDRVPRWEQVDHYKIGRASCRERV